MSYNPDYRTPFISSKTPFCSAYSVKPQTPIVFPENSPHTRQEFKSESDINTIMAQYMRTGELPQINLVAPQYLELDGSSFQEHMQFVADAQNLFNELPSQVRTRFENDPGAFLDFCADPNNRPELARMGLLSTEATRAMLTPSPPSATPPNAPLAPPVIPPAL